MTGSMLCGLAILMGLINPDDKGLFWIAAAIFCLAGRIER